MMKGEKHCLELFTSLSDLGYNFLGLNWEVTSNLFFPVKSCQKVIFKK
jgi:hypothetical protein